MSLYPQLEDPGDRIADAARLLAEERVARPIVVNLRAAFGLNAVEAVQAIRCANALRQEVRQ